MKKKIILGILLLGFISLFIYDNLDLYKRINLNNTGVSEYGSGNFLESQLIFSGAQVNHKDAILEYNKANSLYQMGFKNNNIQEKIDLYQQSVSAYSGSLSLQYNLETEENILYIKNILDTFKNNKAGENIPKDESLPEIDGNDTISNENGKLSNNDNIQEKSEEKSEEEALKNKQEETSGDESGSKSEINNGFTHEEIENYTQKLKDSELYNQKYFNKKTQEITTDINNLYRDSFFEEDFVRGGEKDW